MITKTITKEEFSNRKINLTKEIEMYQVILEKSEGNLPPYLNQMLPVLLEINKLTHGKTIGEVNAMSIELKDILFKTAKNIDIRKNK